MAEAQMRPRDIAVVQVAAVAIVGVVVGLGAVADGHLRLAPLIGWDAGALTYLVWIWASISRLDARATKWHASRDDPTRPGSDLLLLGVSVASLVGVGFVIDYTAHASGALKAEGTILGIGSVVISWFVVHTTFTLRYAKLYHDDPIGGVEFNSDDAPGYMDFAYVAFTVGMTYQVSDTNLTSTPIRRAALRHALLSFLYGTVIIATTINIVAGLAR
ncbi:MAG TPA: DUF1345 domain-containing protein [Micromonosporaceae bacterium]|jgi:uncharacterized membrane protein